MSARAHLSSPPSAPPARRPFHPPRPSPPRPPPAGCARKRPPPACRSGCCGWSCVESPASGTSFVICPTGGDPLGCQTLLDTHGLPPALALQPAPALAALDWTDIDTHDAVAPDQTAALGLAGASPRPGRWSSTPGRMRRSCRPSCRCTTSSCSRNPACCRISKTMRAWRDNPSPATPSSSPAPAAPPTSRAAMSGGARPRIPAYPHDRRLRPVPPVIRIPDHPASGPPRHRRSDWSSRP